MATPSLISVNRFVKILFEKSTNIIIQTTDEFLRYFPVNYFQNPELIRDFKLLLSKSRRLGEESGVGRIFEITDGGETFVIKESLYCPKGYEQKPLLSQLCTMAISGDLVFRLPNTHVHKTIVLAPNYLVEPLVGIILYNRTLKFTPSFMKIYGFQYDLADPQKVTLMITEKLRPINEYITNEFRFIYFIFQITYALNIAQRLGRFVHYDLHRDNIMARPKRTGKLNIYPLQNGKYIYTLFDFDAVIIDYGHTRYETTNTILAPRLIFRPPGSREHLDYYFFNPYYDLFSLLYENYKKIRDMQFPKWTNLALGMHIINILFRQFTNLPQDKNMQDLITHLLMDPNGWRPWPERLATEYMNMDWYRVSTPAEFLIKIGDYIQQFVEEQKSQLHGKEKALAFVNKYGIYITDQIYDLSVYPHINSYTVYGDVMEKESMDTTYYNYQFIDHERFDNIVIKTVDKMPDGVRTTIETFNHTIPESVRSTNNYNRQVIHLATINQLTGRSLGYEFNFDCCRIDLRNYFQHANIMSGIAVNASFFNITGNYMPVGYFKTHDFFSDEKPPSLHKEVYGIIAIKKNGLLVIDKYENRLQYDQVLTSGPILIANRNPVITVNVLRNPIWQCRNPINPAETRQLVFADGIKNCNFIQPGELSHGANPSPRTAIAIDANQQVLIIYVEGRDQRGSGMDLAQLAQLCLRYGAVNAINLDGGFSSQFVWKNPGERIINQLNPTHDVAYPLGSIISYIKKKPV